ncbi:hypothetical protein DIPPA_33264, partial [Diplonema papillatum]
MPRVRVLCGLLAAAGAAGAADITAWSLHRVSDGTGMASDAAVCGGLLAVGEGPNDRVVFYARDSVRGFPPCGVFVSSSPAWNQRYGQQVQCIEATGQTAWIAVLGAKVTEVWRRGTGDLMLSHGNIASASIVVSKLSRTADAWAIDTAVAFVPNVTANSVDVVFDPSRDMIVVVDPVKGIFSRYSLLNTAFYSAGRVEECEDLTAVSSTGPVSCTGKSSVCFVDGEVLVAASHGSRVEVSAKTSGTTAQGGEARTSFPSAHGVAPKLACPATAAGLGEGEVVAVSGGEVFALVEPLDGGWCAFEVASPCDN